MNRKYSGTNTVHAIELSRGNLALQPLGGRTSSVSIPVQTKEERAIQTGIHSLEKKRAKLINEHRATIFTVVPRNPGTMHVYTRGDVTTPESEVKPGGLRAPRGVSASFGIPKNVTDAHRHRRPRVL